jgi:hybrid cluster-associated redox disulfide protein
MKNKHTKFRSKKAAKKPKTIKIKTVKIKQSQLITKNTTFGDIINKYPAAAEILLSKGLHCIGCGMAFAETIEQGAIMHGINPEELVKELNKKLGKK